MKNLNKKKLVETLFEQKKDTETRINIEELRYTIQKFHKKKLIFELSTKCYNELIVLITDRVKINWRDNYIRTGKSAEQLKASDIKKLLIEKMGYLNIDNIPFRQNKKLSGWKLELKI